MTNKEFAAAVGCDVTTASRYRNGHRLPGVALLERIRVVLGVSHDEINRVWAKSRREYDRLGHSPTWARYLRKRAFDSNDQAA